MNSIAIAEIVILLLWYKINSCQCQDIGDIRLVGGTSPVEGRVEVYYHGQWGTICDDLWDDNDATVFCRQLGVNDKGTAVFHAKFGRGRGTIWLDNVECSGSESTLQECSHGGWGLHNCDHTEDAGVYCVNEGEVRVKDGFSSNEGRVEVFHDGQWGTVCDDGWDDRDATVVCRQLGFTSTASAFGHATFGQGSGPIWLDLVICNGTEETLQECTNPGWGVHLLCSHSEDAGVRCEDITENEVRLISNGFSSNRGRVEIFHGGQWGTVCGNGWDGLDALVVCRQLGFEGSVAAYLSPVSDAGSGTIWLDNVDCIGNELSLVECTNRGWGIHHCVNHQYASVRCNNEDTENVLIRLVGGSHNEGRVEVYLNGMWGTVCDDHWDDKDAVVVCRQLGFSTGGTAVLQAAFGKGSGQILLDDVNCSGEEEYLIDCRSTRRDDCSYGEEAGVRCNDTKSCFDVPCLNGGTCIRQSYGYVCVCLNGFYGNTCETELQGTAVANRKGFAIFISFVCLLLVGALAYLAVWIRRIKYSLKSKAFSLIEMQKRNTDNEFVESNRNECKRREMGPGRTRELPLTPGRTNSEDSKEFYCRKLPLTIAAKLYEAV